MVLAPRLCGCGVRLLRRRVDAALDQHVCAYHAHTGASRDPRAEVRMCGISGISTREAGTHQHAAGVAALPARPAGSAHRICQDRGRTARVRRIDRSALATRRAQDRLTVPRVRRSGTGRAGEDRHEFVSGLDPHGWVRALSGSCSRRAQPRTSGLRAHPSRPDTARPHTSSPYPNGPSLLCRQRRKPPDKHRSIARVALAETDRRPEEPLTNRFRRGRCGRARSSTRDCRPRRGDRPR
jgi:hypothetical protein